MFGFTHVLNVTTGAKYFISCAALENEEFDYSIDGNNSYQIDLEPENAEAQSLNGITLIVADGGKNIWITANLDVKGSESPAFSQELGCVVTRQRTQQALVEGKILIVVEDKPCQ